MGKRKITVKDSVATSFAEVSWFIESKGMARTTQKFADTVYDFIEHLADTKKAFRSE